MGQSFEMVRHKGLKVAIVARSSTKEENPPSEDDVQSRVFADGGLEESLGWDP